jgi:hypothetical protein
MCVCSLTCILCELLDHLCGNWRALGVGDLALRHRAPLDTRRAVCSRCIGLGRGYEVNVGGHLGRNGVSVCSNMATLAFGPTVNRVLGLQQRPEVTDGGGEVNLSLTFENADAAARDAILD